MKEKINAKRLAYSTEEAIKFSDGITQEAIDKVGEFICLVKENGNTASRNYGYDRLEEWNEPLYNFIHSTLKKFGFKNGDVLHNDKIPNVKFWWAIYGIMSGVIYSPNLRSKTENHHSSAYERNLALEIELSYLLDAVRK